MIKKVSEFLNYFLEDCLEGDRQFSKKSMFGGYAIYKNEKIFSLFLNDILYFKVGDNNRKYFEKYNSKPFSYEKKSGIVEVMSYWELPEEILENKIELDTWIDRSLLVEANIKSKKKRDLVLDKQILESLLRIPKGKITTYKILADKFGVHSRKVASVMKNNKEPELYPCYKVISHSGKVSGYSGPDGVSSKINMLISDGIKIVNGKINKDLFYNF